MKRPKSTKYLNSQHKPSAKGKVGADLKVGDVFEDERGGQFRIDTIDPEDNTPYLVSWINLGWPAKAYLTYTSIKQCKRV